MNEKLLAWLDRVEMKLKEFYTWPEDAEALAELRAMVKEPMSEEQGDLLKFFDEKMIFDKDGATSATRAEAEMKCDKIRAAIMAKKQSVTRGRLSNFAADVLGATTTSRVVGLTEILLAELGLEVTDE